MGTKLNPGKFDCYENAKPDEPMFILLARDAGAPALVEKWAQERLLQGESPEKLAEALQCANDMRSWWIRDQTAKQVAREIADGLEERGLGKGN